MCDTNNKYNLISDFAAKQNDNFVPTMAYTFGSLLVIFIDNMTIMAIIFLCFTYLSFLLLEDIRIVWKILLITFIVNLLYIFTIFFLTTEFNHANLFYNLPKGFGLSILITSGIVIFEKLPTYQILRGIKFISINRNILYAVMSGLRSVPVTLTISNKVRISSKIRGISSISFLTKILLFNTLILFLEYLYDFQNKLSTYNYFKIEKVNIKNNYYKNIISFIYLFISIGGLLC